MHEYLSSVIRRFKGSDAIEIHDGITFDFYTGLPHVCTMQSHHCGAGSSSHIYTLSFSLVVLVKTVYFSSCPEHSPGLLMLHQRDPCSEDTSCTYSMHTPSHTSYIRSIPLSVFSSLTYTCIYMSSHTYTLASFQALPVHKRKIKSKRESLVDVINVIGRENLITSGQTDELAQALYLDTHSIAKALRLTEQD